MNLLNLNNRFQKMDYESVHELSGYQQCLTDLLRYIELKTEFNPAKRFIDAVKILDSITETNVELKEKLNQAKKLIPENI